MRKWRIACTILAMIAGCSPGAYVVKDPGPFNKGLRFYRPKPYVFLQPAPAPAAAADAAKATTVVDPSSKTYRMTLEYLPDFEEEYSIRVRPGLGTAKVNVNLENGWNLTSLTQDLDTKTAENLTAFVNMIKAVAPGGLLATPQAMQKRDFPHGAPYVEVSGSNVPIGYYESVLMRDPAGKKQLLGFRYVGFLPFATGPGAGISCTPEGPAQLYGLVSEKDKLTFKQLPIIESTPTSDNAQGASTATAAKPAEPAPPVHPTTPGPAPAPSTTGSPSQKKDLPLDEPDDG
jgi:hypothetical protein